MRAGGAAKLVVKNKLIVDDQIDPAAEKKFLLKYKNREFIIISKARFLIGLFYALAQSNSNQTQCKFKPFT